MALLRLFGVLYTLLVEELEKVEWNKSWNHLISHQLVAHQLLAATLFCLFLAGVKASVCPSGPGIVLDSKHLSGES